MAGVNGQARNVLQAAMSITGDVATAVEHHGVERGTLSTSQRAGFCCLPRLEHVEQAAA